MSLILSTTSDTGANLSSEIALGAQFTASADMYVQPSFRLSNLNGAAATFALKARQYASDGTTKIRTFGPYYLTKESATDTVSGEQFDRIFLKSGEKLEVRVASSNASDTNATWSINWNDPTNVTQIAGTVQTPRDLGAGVLVGDKTGFSLAAPDSRVIDSGTAQAGSTSTTIKLAAGASSTSGIYNGEVVFVYGGTGAKQTRTITAYSGTTKVATVDRAWQTTPDNTSLYAVLSVIAAPMNAALQVESSTDELLAIKSNNSRPPAGWPSQFTASLDNGTDTFTNEVFIWCADIDATMGTGTWAIGSFPVIKAPGYVQQSAIGTAYGVIGLIVGDRVYFFLNDAGDWNGEDYKGWHWDGTTFTDGVTISSEPNYFATWTTVGTVIASFSNFVVYNPVRALGTGGNPVTTNPAGQVETSNPGGGLTTDQEAKVDKILDLAQT